MNYDLAKELQDAGFPYKAQSFPLFVSEDGEVPARVPTLEELIEELIEACKNRGGYPAFELSWIRANTADEWMAKLFSKVDNPEAKGPTPTEAVARLWLALQKK